VAKRGRTELVVITGLSGSGKATVLKAFEDLGYYAVDNLPIELIPKFAELAKDSAHVRRAALVIDIREGEQLAQFPALFQKAARRTPATLVFLEADDARWRAGSARHGVRIRWVRRRRCKRACGPNASCWRRFAAWPITSSILRSSTCTSCAK
jgi:hypothetical protein